ncbi:conserved hypothetical protein [Planktothrix serta PCC 8927]|uniref:Uncharacterized protein n=1 Tax=Planktothrix serta PCC 8927 TaxID=671068 RepID=A0A7Z9BYM2_9CYAN|nr:hypothetical protein [Planktothrix serta]VXD23999.1 conserved hypothetical protein [Planktothrix serta PCC 8927]
MKKCNGLRCKWIQNSHNSNHWVCLACGKERHIEHSDPVWTFIIIIAIALIVTFTLGSNSSPQNHQQDPENYPESIESKPQFLEL